VTSAWRRRAADSLGRIVEWEPMAPHAVVLRRTSIRSARCSSASTKPSFV
jgi:hypothetical protein